MKLEAAVYSSAPPPMGLIAAATGIQRTGKRNAYGCWPEHEDVVSSELLCGTERQASGQDETIVYIVVGNTISTNPSCV